VDQSEFDLPLGNVSERTWND